MLLGGHLPTLLDVISLIEPVRAGRELHTTSIRNEHAYHCCIHQLIPFSPFSKIPPQPIQHLKPFFVAGDSHCLTPAWQTIQFQGEERALLPLLVTGLKIWHLRAESRFFPKNNFYNVIKKVPDGSEIIFLFGEIDCREGLVVSVERLKYKDLEEGMTVTIDIYVEVLLQLVKERNFRIYIHPIVPVLNETRFIVKQFNGMLFSRLEALNCPSVKCLHFFNDLLNPITGGLEPTYELDGTHLNPSYVPLISRTLQSTQSSANA